MEAEDTKVHGKNGPGVIYFSSIPTDMNVAMLSEVLQRFGNVKRVYLVPCKQVLGKAKRQYSEGWVEFEKRKQAKKAGHSLNCTEVPGGKFLPKVSWGDLFAIERQGEEQRRIQKDRDILMAKRQARLFKSGLDSHKLEARLRASKKQRFKERSAMSLEGFQKPTEQEIKDRIARSARTVPEDIEGFSALTDKKFMDSLFSGGL